MSWRIRPSGRSLPVNGDLLTFHRHRNGLTQASAAHKSGYSLRLIRKAESGGPLHPDTVEVLAETYSTTDFVVFPEDLIANPVALASQLLESYVRDGRQLVQRIQSILDPEMEFHYAGDPNEIPFAGTHRTIDGFDRFWSMFFDTWVPDNHTIFRPKIVADGNDVYSFAVDQCQVPGAGVVSKTSNGSWDVFLLNLTTSGGFGWADTIGGTGEDSVNGLAIDRLGNVSIVGSFYGTMDFDPSTGTYQRSAAGSGRAGYLARYRRS